MAKLEAFTHLDTMRGKYAKTDKVYTKVRKFDEQIIGVRLKHPVTNDPPSEGQRQAQEKFATIHALVKTTLADTTRKAELKAEWKKQQKYKTLTGYVFHKLYHSEEGGYNG